MNLSNSGIGTLISSVTSIEQHGFWILLEDKEYFVSFNDYPDFKKASVESIYNVQILSKSQMHWPDLDVDIEVKALENPKKFNLVYKD